MEKTSNININWGDEYYYIDIDFKNKKIYIKKGSLIGVVVYSTECFFRLRNEKEDKEVEVETRECSRSFEDLASTAQSMLYDLNEHDLWSCFEED